MAKVVNTRGAAAILGLAVVSVHKAVEAGRLKAYYYDANGNLVPRRTSKHPGAGLFFYESDLLRYKKYGLREPNKARRYTDEDRARVCQLHAQGMSNRDIGKQLGIGYQSVNNWLKEEASEEAGEQRQPETSVA